MPAFNPAGIVFESVSLLNPYPPLRQLQEHTPVSKVLNLLAKTLPDLFTQAPLLEVEVVATFLTHLKYLSPIAEASLWASCSLHYFQGCLIKSRIPIPIYAVAVTTEVV